jgi:hypothetical protein
MPIQTKTFSHTRLIPTHRKNSFLKHTSLAHNVHRLPCRLKQQLFSCLQPCLVPRTPAHLHISLLSSAILARFSPECLLHTLLPLPSIAPSECKDMQVLPSEMKAAIQGAAPASTNLMPGLCPEVRPRCQSTQHSRVIKHAADMGGQGQVGRQDTGLKDGG